MTKKNSTGRQTNPFDPVGSFDSATGWRKWLVVVIVLVLVLAVLMPELVLQDRIFLSPDTKAPLSFKYIGRESYEAGIYSTDTQEGIVLNEAAIKAMGMESPIEKRFECYIGDEFQKAKIIGVVKDFNFQSI